MGKKGKVNKPEAGTQLGKAPLPVTSSSKAAQPPPPPAVAVGNNSGAENGAVKKKKRKKKKKPAASSSSAGGGEADSDEEDELIPPTKPSTISAARKTTTATTSSSSTINEGGNKLDPIALTIKECVKRGFPADEVEAMVSEMFDQEKPYDNVQAVIFELQRKRGGGTFLDDEAIPPELYYDMNSNGHGGQQQHHHHQAALSPPKPPAATSTSPSKKQSKNGGEEGGGGAQQQPAIDNPAVIESTTTTTTTSSPSKNKKGKKEKGEVSTASSPPATSSPPAFHRQAPPTATGSSNNKATKDQPAVAAASSKASSALSSPPPQQKHQTPPQPSSSASPAINSLEARLEAAASSEDVDSSLDALTVYSRMADAEGRRALVVSHALDILLKNILRRCLAQPKGYPSGFVKEIGLFLTDFLGTDQPLDNLVAVIKHVQALNASHKLSGEVVESIATALATSLKESKKQSDASKSAGKDLAEIEGRLKSEGNMKGVGKTSSIRDLFEARENYFQAMNLHEAACRILVTQLDPSSSSSAQHAASLSPTRRVLDKSKRALVDAVLKESLGWSSEELKKKRQEIAAVKSELSSVNSAMEVDLQPLIQEAETCKAQLGDLRHRREALVRQLAELDVDIKGVESRLHAREKTVTERRETLENSWADKDKRLKGMLSIIREANEADELAQKMNVLGNTLQVEIKSSRSGQQGEMEKKLRSRIKAFAAGFEPYLDVEVRCYEFLKERSERLEAEKVKMLNEVGTYKSMGMHANVQDLISKAQANEDNVEEDRQAMASLRESSSNHYQAFRAALDRAGGPGADWMIKAGISLVGIKQLLDRLNLAKDWLPGLAAELPPTSSIPFLSSPASPLAPVVGQLSSPAPQQVAARPPKATTATSITSSKKPPVSPQHSFVPGHASVMPATGQRSPGVAAATGAGIAPSPASSPSAPAVIAPAVMPPLVSMPKFSWANRMSSASPVNDGTGGAVGEGGKQKKSLIQIQEEERQSRLTEENLRRLEDGEAKLKAKLAFIGVSNPNHHNNSKELGGSSEAELNSTTDRTLGSEGLTDLSGVLSGLGGPAVGGGNSQLGGAPGLTLSNGGWEDGTGGKVGGSAAAVGTRHQQE